MRDLSFAVKGWGRRPGFTLLAVATLALGIGFSTSMFSLIDGLWLKRYPFPDAERLLVVTGTNPQNEIEESGVSLPDVADLRQASKTLDDVAVLWPVERNLTGGETARHVKAIGASANLFRVLGGAFEHGRGFTDDEDHMGAEPVVILSDHLWRRQFGADPGVVGRSIELDGNATTVVGVLAPGAQFPDSDNADLFVPLGLDFQRMPRRGRPFSAVARLAAGATLENAQAELDTLAAKLETDNPMSNQGWRFRAIPLRTFRTRDFQPLVPLAVLVLVVLLIACANVANLLLQRATQRRGEMAVRSALGASRRRLVRLLTVESVALAAAAALAGIAIAFLLLRLTQRLIPVARPSTLDLRLDLRSALFAVAAAAVCALLAGLAPALFSSGRNPARDLAAAGRGLGGGRRSRRLSDLFLVVEVALALVLLVGSLLTVRSFRHLLDVDPGFRTGGVLSMEVGLPRSRYDMPPQKMAYFRQLEESLGAVPGVSAVGLGSRLPFGDYFSTSLTLEGQTAEQAEGNPSPNVQNVLGDYFRVLGLPLVAGRYLNDSDRGDGEPVVVLSAGLAERLWPGEPAVDKRLRTSIQRSDDWARVVGVVGDVRFTSLASEPDGDIYLPFQQLPMGGMSLFVRTEGAPAAVIPGIRQAVRRLDADVPVEDIRPLDRVVADSIWLQRVASVLFTLFAAVALLLTLVGIYAAIAYSVARRSREIGIRMAFGSDRGVEARRVVKGALAVTAAGIVLGVAGALLLGKLYASLLYGVTASDPATFAAAVVLLLAGAALAALVPSWRAAKLDPVRALRSE